MNKSKVESKKSKVWYCILLLFLFCSVANAELGNLNNFINLGYVKSGSMEMTAFTWSPNMSIGPWAMGVDVNIPLNQTRPVGFDNVVMRFAEYNDGQKGLRYGILDGVTWGKGLLMKNYSTRTVGPIMQNNQQTAFKGYLNTERVGVQILSTWSNIYAVRLTEKPNSWLNLGQSYITDTDGPSITQPDGTTIKYPSVSGAAVDASIPLPLNLEGYAEAATLFGHGTGLTVGVNWGFDAMVFNLGFDAGYRALDNRFVPSYFSADYETNPVNLTSYEATGQAKNGYLAELRVLAGQFFKASALYEAYNGSNTALTGSAAAEMDKIFASIYYKQPDFKDFRSLSYEQGAISGGALGYKVNQAMWLVINYKKAYDPVLGQVLESQYYEVKFSL